LPLCSPGGLQGGFLIKERSTPMEEKILSAVSTVGFPIVITFYLLIRFQTTMDKFCDKLDALILEIRKEHS
jgi:hypothetical protein